ncbi:MAG: hypothetical protein WAU82_03055, partial [Candidatus Binatus sp.]|uniref:hypothetical protein n=1 Tax=Candidatus Binatus sp. TaxID=2811406 RepID=UPI003BB0689F
FNITQISNVIRVRHLPSLFSTTNWCSWTCVWRITDFPGISNSPHTGKIAFMAEETAGAAERHQRIHKWH